MPSPLILASTSKFRAEVLRDAGYEFEVIAPGIDEKTIRDSDPEVLVAKLAKAKAEDVAKNIKDQNVIIIGSDQVVLCNGELREKPANENEARTFFRSYATHPLELVNAIHLINPATKKSAYAISKTIVTFHPTLKNIEDEVMGKGIVMHCAGAIQIEDPLVQKHIASSTGTEDSYKGMPLATLKHLLDQF